MMHNNLISNFRLLAFLIGMSPVFVFGQTKEVLIPLTNSSFEDQPQCCEVPTGWFDCGSSAAETAPDIQPGSFDVSKPPSHGVTYIGLVVRDNETWEGLGQRLPAPLEKGQCYEFGIFLARSELYMSQSRTTGAEVNYTSPAKVRIYGGNGYCDRRELLAESASITHHRWLKYNFPLRPKNGTYSYILIEVYYNTPVLFPYNGNVLIDNASPIKKVDCSAKPQKPDEKDTSTTIATNVPPKKQPTKPPTSGTPPTGTKSPSVAPVPYSTSTPAATFAKENVKKNAIIPLDKVFFEADKFDLKDEVVPAMLEILTFMNQYPTIKIEIGGHTNDTPPHEYCDKLSTNRAKSVSDWLVRHGVSEDRVQYKGYGKRNPIYDNKTAVGRKKNQRVEIKILSIEG